MRTNFHRETFPEGWHLPVVPVGGELNPFEGDGVRMYAVLGYALPYETMKSLAVIGLLEDAAERGLLGPATTLVEATSGALGLVLTEFGLSRTYGVKDVVLIMNDDVPHGKRLPPHFAGARIIPPEEGISGIATARKMGGGGWTPEGPGKSGQGWLNLDQYANPANGTMYRQFAAPRILNAMRMPARTVLVTPIGTGGTGIGLGGGMREHCADGAVIVGVRCAPNEEIPGARDLARMKEISLPWEHAFDHIVEVRSKEAYLSCLWAHWAEGLAPGPTGGMAHVGAVKFLKRTKELHALDTLRDRDGKIHVAVVFHDGWRPYVIDRMPSFVHRDHQRPATAPKPWELD